MSFWHHTFQSQELGDFFHENLLISHSFIIHKMSGFGSRSAVRTYLFQTSMMEYFERVVYG